VSVVTDAITGLNNLLAIQKQVNAAIEMTAPGNLQNSMISKRANIRAFENAYIIPYQSKLVSDVMPGYLTATATQVIGPINKAISVESSILSNKSSAMSGKRIKISHPLGDTLLNDIESFVSPGSTETSYSADDAVDIPTGQAALGYYFNESIKYSNFPYTDVASMIADLDDVNGDLTSTIGFTIRSIGLSDSQVQAAMTQLADTGQGNLPVNTTVFFTALSQAGENPSFWSAIQFVAVSSFQEAVMGAQALGNEILTAAATTTGFIQYLPYLAIAGLGVYVFIKAGGIEAIADVFEGKK
jgi:hypothetical protein